MEAIVFIILQTFFATRRLWNLGSITRIFPSLSSRIFTHVARWDQSLASENICFTRTAEILARSLVNFYCQQVCRSTRLLVLLLRAKNNQNCSFCDKSMKLPRITNLYKVNIFWYGAIPNLRPQTCYAHVKKLHIWPLRGNEAELKCLFLSFLRSSLPRFLAS